MNPSVLIYYIKRKEKWKDKEIFYFSQKVSSKFVKKFSKYMLIIY